METKISDLSYTPLTNSAETVAILEKRLSDDPNLIFDVSGTEFAKYYLAHPLQYCNDFKGCFITDHEYETAEEKGADLRTFNYFTCRIILKNDTSNGMSKKELEELKNYESPKIFFNKGQ